MNDDVRVIGLRGIPELSEGDDLAELLASAAERAVGIRDGDIVVVAQKAVSKVEVESCRSRTSLRPSGRASSPGLTAIRVISRS